MRSSIETGVGLNNARMRVRSSGAGSAWDFSVSSLPSSSDGRSAPMIGRSTETISSASVTGVAFCLIRLLVPSDRGSSGEPGTANTSRPCSSGNQRAGALGRFDDDDSERKARDQPIAPRKISCAGLPAKGHFGQRRSARQDVLEQAVMLGRIDAILATGEDCNRPCCDTGAMRGGIDAPGETGDNGKSCFA
jgi:hypothetical protein